LFWQRIEKQPTKQKTINTKQMNINADKNIELANMTREKIQPSYFYLAELILIGW
jgi:hypothetical protein